MTLASDLAGTSTTDRIIVGVGDLRAAAADALHPVQIVTYALGSCLGVVIHDPVARVGGLLHLMLPDSSLDASKAASTPAMFVDTGVPLLFKACYALGARKERLVVKVAGGSHAAVREEDDRFQIGKRNLLALRRILWRNQVMIAAEDVGGSQRSRTVTLHVATGAITLRAEGRDAPL